MTEQTVKRPVVKSLREVTIRTTKGHTVVVPADTPTEIPASILEDAFLLGCVQVNTDYPSAETIAENKAAAEAAKQEKAAATRAETKSTADSIYEAVATVCERGTPSDFKNSDGSPKVAAIQRQIGKEIKVNSEKVIKAFTRYQIEQL